VIRAMARSLAATLVVVAAFGCGERRPLPSSDVVARLGGDEIRYGAFNAYLDANVGESDGGLESEALSALLDQFLDERLLVRLAVERGLVAPAAGPAAAVSALLDAEGSAPLTSGALAGYYAEHSNEFRSPERVALRVIRVESRVGAERARRELRAGADFAEVARRLSSDPTAGMGGEQGELARDELPRKFADAIFALRPGEVSDILSSDEGFYLFQVARKVPERALAFDEARDDIVRRLSAARADRAYARFVAEAGSKYAVAVYDRNLPFAYRGRFPVERPYENR